MEKLSSKGQNLSGGKEPQDSKIDTKAESGGMNAVADLEEGEIRINENQILSKKPWNDLDKTTGMYINIHMYILFIRFCTLNT